MPDQHLPAPIGEDGVRDVTIAPRNDAAAVGIGSKSWPFDIRLRPWVFRPHIGLLPLRYIAATVGQHEAVVVAPQSGDDHADLIAHLVAAPGRSRGIHHQHFERAQAASRRYRQQVLAIRYPAPTVGLPPSYRFATMALHRRW